MTEAPIDTPKLRIGHMPYANSLVFYSQLPPDKVELITLPPRNMAEAMKQGQLDAGPLPIYEVLKMGDAVVPLGKLGVATDGNAHSVLLFSRLRAENLGGKRIAVTSHTSTSVQLLRILMRDLWNISDVQLVGPNDPSDAKLIIGDEALALRRGPANSSRSYDYVYDLAGEWKSLTVMPFVFARWVARREADTAQLGAMLDASFQHGMSTIEELARSVSIPHYDARDIRDYIRSFTYMLGPAEIEAIDLFRIRLNNLPEWSPPVMPYHETDEAARNGGTP